MSARAHVVILAFVVGFFALGTVARGASALEPIVSAQWMAERLNDPSVRVVEVSVDPTSYAEGHLPGAVHLAWHTDLVDPVRRDIVSEEGFEALASAAGIGPDTTVIIYGDHNNWFAAWGAWIFKVYGVNDVRLLDGGRKKWVAEGRPMTTQPAVHALTDYEVTEKHPDLRARLDDVVAVAEGRAPGILLDIRSPDEYSGKIFAPEGVQELAIRAGHIPGAKNVPWSEAVNADDGTMKSVDELRALYAAVGIDGTQPVIVYCRIGERSSHTWFVLHEILGYENVRQYDGSWTEYGNTVGLPITNLAGTVWTGR